MRFGTFIASWYSAAVTVSRVTSQAQPFRSESLNCSAASPAATGIAAAAAWYRDSTTYGALYE